MTNPAPKTLKREFAVGILAIYFGLLIAGVWSEGAAEAAESLKVQAFLFAGFAFGMDSYAKQVR